MYKRTTIQTYHTHYLYHIAPTITFTADDAYILVGPCLAERSGHLQVPRERRPGEQL